MTDQHASVPDHEAENAMAPTDNSDEFDESQCIESLDELIEKARNSMWRELEEWYADTEGRKRNREELGKVIAEWEAEHGAFTPEEIEAAEAQLYG